MHNAFKYDIVSGKCLFVELTARFAAALHILPETIESKQRNRKADLARNLVFLAMHDLGIEPKQMTLITQRTRQGIQNNLFAAKNLLLYSEFRILYNNVINEIANRPLQPLVNTDFLCNSNNYIDID